MLPGSDRLSGAHSADVDAFAHKQDLQAERSLPFVALIHAGDRLYFSHSDSSSAALS
jgi:hypothetical protein